jgi:hypothetical protein
MTIKTNRRGVLRAVIATGSAVALSAPTIASSPALSALDQHVLELWHQRVKLLTIVDRIVEQREPENAALNERWDAANGAIHAVERTIEEHTAGSVMAIAAFLIWTIEDDQRHDIVLVDSPPWLPHFMLRAIRHQLVGQIAEDADRVLGRGEDSDGGRDA